MSRAQYRKTLRDLQKTDERLGEIAEQLSAFADLLTENPERARISPEAWPSDAEISELLALRRTQARTMAQAWKMLTVADQAQLKLKIGAYAPKKKTGRK